MENKIEQQEKKILLLKEHNKKQGEKIKDIGENLQKQVKKIEQQDKEILLLKEDHQKQGEEISFLKKYVSGQIIRGKKFLKITNKKK